MGSLLNRAPYLEFSIVYDLFCSHPDDINRIDRENIDCVAPKSQARTAKLAFTMLRKSWDEVICVATYLARQREQESSTWAVWVKGIGWRDSTGSPIRPYYFGPEPSPLFADSGQFMHSVLDSYPTDR